MKRHIFRYFTMASTTMALPTQKTIFLANWGAYFPIEQSFTVLDELLADCNPSTQQHLLALPLIYLEKILDKYRQSGLIFGTDSILSVTDGSFTEPISIRLIKEAQAQFTLLNSYENTTCFPENANNLPKKIKAVIQAGLTPFLCIGETLAEYVDGSSNKVLSEKLSEALHEISPHQLINLNIVYEAPWINQLTYQPSLDQLVNAYRQCREILQSQVGIQMANAIRLICAVPHDFENLSSLIQQGGINGLYLTKAILYQNQLHRMFASDLSLHGEFEKPVIDEKIMTETSIINTESDLAIEEPVINKDTTPQIVEEKPKLKEDEIIEKPGTDQKQPASEEPKLEKETEEEELEEEEEPEPEEEELEEEEDDDEPEDEESKPEDEKEKKDG